MTRPALCVVLSLSILSAAGTARAAAPSAGVATTDAPDPQAAERARIVMKGKRLGWIGLAFSGAGLLVSISSTAGTQFGSTAGIIGASTGVALCIAGVGLAGAGLRRVRHPEKFMRKAQLAAAPWGNRTGGGVALSLRF